MKRAVKLHWSVKTQADEAAEQDDKTCQNNDQDNIITVNENVNWLAQDKINNKQKKDKYNDVLKKYLQRMYDQWKKLFIRREDAI